MFLSTDLGKCSRTLIPGLIDSQGLVLVSRLLGKSGKERVLVNFFPQLRHPQSISRLGLLVWTHCFIAQFSLCADTTAPIIQTGVEVSDLKSMGTPYVPWENNLGWYLVAYNQSIKCIDFPSMACQTGGWRGNPLESFNLALICHWLFFSSMRNFLC